MDARTGNLVDSRSAETRPSVHRPRSAARHSILRCAIGLLVMCTTYLVESATASAQFLESLEAPEKSWRMADHDCSLRLIQHARTFEQAHAGQASEFVQFHAGAGTYVHLVHDIPASRVIDELNISLWVKSNRAGLQLAARVVLPRSKDPRTGSPLTTLIRGNSYAQAGTWQKLTIDQPALLVSRQVPLLRSQLETDISDREAYVDLVVLNAYGGTGQTDSGSTIWRSRARCRPASRPSGRPGRAHRCERNVGGASASAIGPPAA